MHRMTLGEMLARTADQWGDREAIVWQHVRLRYREYDARVSQFAHALRRLGIGSGDKVAVLLPNCPQFPTAYFGAARIGATVVPVSAVLGVEEVEHVLTDSGARALVTMTLFDQLVGAARGQCPDLERLIVSGPSELDGALRFEDLCQREPTTPPDADVSPDDVAVLIYTSGTTGRPKGAMLSHHNLVSNAGACREAIDVHHNDNFLTVLPLFHSFGATVCMVLPALIGACSTLLSKFVPLDVMRAMEQERCTLLAGVPSMYAVMLRAKTGRQYDLSSLRMAVTGGAPMPAEVMAAFSRRHGVVMLEGYGPTEASPVVSVNPFHGVRKPCSVGPPLPGVRVRVVDPEGRDLPPDEVGEILVAGDNIMLGYYRMPAETAATIRDGWLHTGDLGCLDEDGYLYIVDRMKDMIIVGGMNVYPREVEDVLQSHPAVLEAAIVGVPNNLRGEDVVAYVTLIEDRDVAPHDLLELCGRRLARFKVPRRIEIRKEMPRSMTGKVLKRELRQQALQSVPAASLLPGVARGATRPASPEPPL